MVATSSSSSLCDEQDEREQHERALLCGEADLLRLRESGERDTLLRLVVAGDGDLDRERERESLRSGEAWREITGLVCCGEDMLFSCSMGGHVFFLLRNVYV